MNQKFRILKDHRIVRDEFLSNLSKLRSPTEKRNFILLNWNPLHQKFIPFLFVQELLQEHQMKQMQRSFKTINNLETYFDSLIKFRDELYKINRDRIQDAIDTKNIGLLESLAINVATVIGVKLNSFLSFPDTITFLEDLFEEKLKYISLLSTCQSDKGCAHTTQVLNLLLQKEPIAKELRHIQSEIVTRKLQRNDLLFPLVDSKIQNHQHVRFLTSADNDWLYASFNIPQHEYILLGEIDCFGSCGSFVQVNRRMVEDQLSMVTSWDPCKLTHQQLFQLHATAQNVDLSCRLQTLFFSLLFKFDVSIPEDQAMQCTTIIKNAGGKIAVKEKEYDLLITAEPFGARTISPAGLHRKCFHFMGGKQNLALSRPIFDCSLETIPDHPNLQTHSLDTDVIGNRILS